jgi:hypothetical protein
MVKARNQSPDQAVQFRRAASAVSGTTPIKPIVIPPMNRAPKIANVFLILHS